MNPPEHHGYTPLLRHFRLFRQKTGTTWSKANCLTLRAVQAHGWVTIAKVGRYWYYVLTPAGDAELDRCEALGR